MLLDALKPMKRLSVFFLSVWLVAVVEANDFPAEPLTLSTALSFAEQPHPFTSNARLDLELAKVNQDFHGSSNRLDLEALIVPQRVDQAAPKTGGSFTDSYATLRIRHPIYDFGRGKANQSHASTDLAIAEHNLKFVQATRKIEIMQRFFDVLIADLDYGVKNEKMTLTFLRYNRYQEEMDMHQSHAEVDVLDLETIYREAFVVRQAANFARRNARRTLALALGFTDYVPRDLATPDVSAYVAREVPEFEILLDEVLQNNHDMKQAELNLDKATAASEVSKSKYLPQLDAVLEATNWHRETGSRNATSVGIQFTVPLVSGARKSRDQRISHIAVERARARLAETEHAVRQKTFDLWQALTLHHVRLSAAEVRLNYRDQYMDRARALYELEERSDLGDAQAELLRALLESNRVEYALALTWSELDALMGKPVFPF